MRKTILVLMLGLALAAFTVAGCGGDDDESATDTETTTEAGGTIQPGDTLLGSVGPGFEISVWASGMPNARSHARSMATRYASRL